VRAGIAERNFVRSFRSAIVVLARLACQRHVIFRGNPPIVANTRATLVVIVDGVEERQDIMICEDARSEEPVAFV
jgi:hypothetical protein